MRTLLKRIFLLDILWILFLFNLFAVVVVGVVWVYYRAFVPFGFTLAMSNIVMILIAIISARIINKKRKRS